MLGVPLYTVAIQKNNLLVSFPYFGVIERRINGAPRTFHCSEYLCTPSQFKSTICSFLFRISALSKRGINAASRTFFTVCRRNSGRERCPHRPKKNNVYESICAVYIIGRSKPLPYGDCGNCKRNRVGDDAHIVPKKQRKRECLYG